MFSSICMLFGGEAGPPPNPLWNGLQFYYKMDGNSHEELGGTNGTDTNVLYDSAYGKINQGGDFDGSTSQIVTTVSPTVLGASSRTSSVWVKSTMSGGALTVMPIFGYGSPLPQGMWTPTIHHMEMGGPIMETFVLDLGGAIVLGPTIVVMGLWHHVVWVYDGVNATCYLDNVAWTPTAAAPNTAAGVLGIGKAPLGLNKFKGDIDEIAMWDRVLTPAEITELYNAGAGKQYPT